MGKLRERCAKLIRSVLRLAFWALWGWSILLICLYDPCPRWLRLPFGLALALAPWISRWQSKRLKVPAAIAGILLALVLRAGQQPTNNRQWVAEQDQLVTAMFEDDMAHIRNLRYMSRTPEGARTVRWYDATYDLNTIESVDFVVAPFAAWRGIAHTFVTFGFEDGEHVSVSAESRKERDELFSALMGLFRRYEITYNMGDERDFIGLRSHVDKIPVYVFPIRATHEQVKAMFVSMLMRANQLAVFPEYYNTLTKNCTTSVVGHMEEVRGKRLPFDLRVVFPGYADDLAHELGLIEAECVDSSTRETFRVPIDVPLGDHGPEWSRLIRSQ